MLASVATIFLLLPLAVLLFSPVVSAQESAAPTELAKETKIGGTGVHSRLSQRGMDYVAKVLINTLLSDGANLTPIVPKTHIELPNNGKVSLVSMKLIVQDSPPPMSRTVHTQNRPPNSVQLDLKPFGFLSKAELSVRGIPTTVIAEFHALQSGIHVAATIQRNADGAMRLHIEHCNVSTPEPFRLRLGDGAQLNDRRAELEEVLSKHSAQLMTELVCAQVESMVDERLNARFALLSRKITLAKLSDDAIVDDLVSKMQRVHRKQRSAASWYRAGRIRREALITSKFNISHADDLYLDYTIVSDPRVTALGLEVETSGEVSVRGGGGTPFGPMPIPFPDTLNEEFMLQMAVSDFIPNSMMFHGHKIGIFNTRIDPSTPQFGALMRTSCSASSKVLFCLGDMFPTLRRLHPDHRLALVFNTVQSPLIQFHPPSAGGITFALKGKIDFSLLSESGSETAVASMGISVRAHMKMRITSADVRPKIALDSIKLTTMTPDVLTQKELDDAVILSREVLQRMINDILSDGIPIPIHPLFKLTKPKVMFHAVHAAHEVRSSDEGGGVTPTEYIFIKMLERSMLLQTNFELNETLLRHLIAVDPTKARSSSVGGGKETSVNTARKAAAAGTVKSGSVVFHVPGVAA